MILTLLKPRLGPYTMRHKASAIALQPADAKFACQAPSAHLVPTRPCARAVPTRASGMRISMPQPHGISLQGIRISASLCWILVSPMIILTSTMT